MLTTLTTRPDTGNGTFKRPDTKYHYNYCTRTNSLIRPLFHLKDKKDTGTPTDLIQSALSSISAALFSFAPR